MVAQRFSAGSNIARSASTLPKALSADAYHHPSHELCLRHLGLLHRPSGRPSAIHLNVAFDFDTETTPPSYLPTSALSPGGTSEYSPP
jgi:hypothetical protein